MVGPCAFNSLGRWTGEHIRSERGQSDIPLSALEFLSFLKTAQHITGCERYSRGVQAAGDRSGLPGAIGEVHCTAPRDKSFRRGTGVPAVLPSVPIRAMPSASGGKMRAAKNPPRSHRTGSNESGSQRYRDGQLPLLIPEAREKLKRVLNRFGETQGMPNGHL